MQANRPAANKSAGDAAETLAAAYLATRGLRVLERNWRTRGGEIDLICSDGATLVFVEVRLRTHSGYGGAVASIANPKQRRLILAARHYLMTHGAAADDRPCRFDAVLLDGIDEARIEWIRNAFSAD